MVRPHRSLRGRVQRAWGSAQIDFSRVGTLVYRSSKVGGGLVTVQWLDASGNTARCYPSWQLSISDVIAGREAGWR